MLENEGHIKEHVAQRINMRIVSRIITILYSCFSLQSRFFKIGASILKEILSLLSVAIFILKL